MAHNFHGKVAVVTGSTTGIGKAVAHALAKNGCSVVLTGIATEMEAQDLLQEFKLQYKIDFHFVPGDFLSTDSTEQFCRDVIAIYPDGPHILVNNAGIAVRGLVENIPTEDWLKSIAVNLNAPFLLCKAFFPLMKKRGWGRVINMSSQMGLIADYERTPYATTKSALIGMSRVLALEGAAFGVTCNAVCPGYVDAPMTHGLIDREAQIKGISYEESKKEFAEERHPMHRLIPLSEVVDLVLFLCSNSASSISGSPIPIDAANMAR